MEIQDRPQITVVVPVYKVEKYLGECVDSILGQTFSDLECILVDDGSPDRCGSICDEYAKKDPRVRVIHKENGGLSDARNAGIDAARGEFITFIDSDDYVVDYYLQYLYDAARKYDADIVQGNITTHLEKFGTKGTDRRGKPYEVKVFSREESISDYLLYRTHYSNSTVKLFRTALFEEIRFPKGKLSEDEYTTYRLVLASRRDVCLPDYIYYYRLHEGSIVRSYSRRRFEVCAELPKLIGEALRGAGIRCDKELDYKNMRIQLKIYNDFIQGGQYASFKKDLKVLEKRIRKIPVSDVWDRKYIGIKYALSTVPWLYRKMVYRLRNSLRV